MKKRIMVDMSATIIHHGHIRLLKKASKYGDVIVALTTDDEVLKQKGYLPELDFNFRKEILESIKYVKEVVPSLWKLNDDFLKKNNINLLVHGEDNSNDIDKKKLLILPRTKGVSSSELRKKSASIANKIKKNILLNPGPATTTDTVKYAQVVPDICPREKEFGDFVYMLGKKITSIVSNTSLYETTFFGGSGTSAVESIISSVFSSNDNLLIIENGAYGKRISEISRLYNVNFEIFESKTTEPINHTSLEALLKKSSFTHIAVVHHETTTGLLNKLEPIGKLAKKYNIKLIVDAMSSFAAIPINMEKNHISYLAASSNKNIQGMAGISFVIGKVSELEKLSLIKPKNLYLNLFEQYSFFSKTKQFRFTPPVQTIYALNKAVEELLKEGITKRFERYTSLWVWIIEFLDKHNIKYLIEKEAQSRLITSINIPKGFDFEKLHDYFKQRSITIYPSKIKDHNSFRVANIGDLNENDIKYFLEQFEILINQNE